MFGVDVMTILREKGPLPAVEVGRLMGVRVSDQVKSARRVLDGLCREGHVEKVKVEGSYLFVYRIVRRS